MFKKLAETKNTPIAKKSQFLSEQNIGLSKLLGHVHPTFDNVSDPPGSRGT